MILGRYLLTSLILYINFYESVIEVGLGTHKGCTTHMFDLSTYKFKQLNTKNGINPEYFFTGTYIDNCFEYENLCKSDNIMPTILDEKYKKYDFNKVIHEQCQELIVKERS